MDPEAVVYGRTLDDATLQSLTVPSATSKTGIYHGHIDETMKETDFPRITFHFPSDVRLRRTYADVRVMVYAWAWPRGPQGGWARVRAIDAQLRALLDEQQWEHDGMLVYAFAGAGRDLPAEPNLPIGFARPYTLSDKTVSA